MDSIPQNVSESTRRRNPGLYGPGAPVGAMEAGKRERSEVRALDKGGKQRRARKGSVAVIVTLITCRSRELDDDGNVAALKPLRDAIAASLGIDDGDKRIRFEYGQQVSQGEQGVIVKVEFL